MRVGVIGPTDIQTTSTAAGLDPSRCEETAQQAGKALAERGWGIVVVPDRGVGWLAAQAYHEAGGSACTCIIPTEGTSAQVAESCCESSLTYGSADSPHCEAASNRGHPTFSCRNCMFRSYTS